MRNASAFFCAHRKNARICARGNLLANTLPPFRRTFAPEFKKRVQMNNLIALLGLGGLALYFMQKQSFSDAQESFNEELEKLRKQVIDLGNDVTDLGNEFDDSVVGSSKPDVIRDNFAKTLDATLGVVFMDHETFNTNASAFLLTFTNNSDYEYRIKYLKVRLFAGGELIDAYAPGDKRGVIVRPGREYKMYSVWTNEPIFTERYRFDRMLEDLMAEGVVIDFGGLQEVKTEEPFVKANISIQVEKVGAGTLKVIEYKDIPVKFLMVKLHHTSPNREAYTKEKVTGPSNDMNAIEWEDADFDFDK